jgi:ParB family chromosome partitioning protein
MNQINQNNSQNKSRLGKGFESLVSPGVNRNTLAAGRTISQIEIKEIVPNPRQPRQFFNDESIQELSDSIKEFGIAQPLIVRRLDNGYELIAGERRLRAAKKAGLTQVPVIIRTSNNEESLALALIENIQRENISPLEEAEAYAQLAEEFTLTQEQIAKKVGKSRSTIANILRLNDLPLYIKDALRRGTLSASHARTLLSIQEPDLQKKTFDQIVSGNLNVREAEGLSKKNSPSAKSKSLSKKKDFALSDAEQTLSSFFGTKVSIAGTQQKGVVHLHYFSKEDLERLIEIAQK